MNKKDIPRDLSVSAILVHTLDHLRGTSNLSITWSMQPRFLSNTVVNLIMRMILGNFITYFSVAGDDLYHKFPQNFYLFTAMAQ